MFRFKFGLGDCIVYFWIDEKIGLLCFMEMLFYFISDMDVVKVSVVEFFCNVCFVYIDILFGDVSLII